MTRIVWYVDEDAEDVELNVRSLNELLQSETGDDFSVRPICPPFAKFDNYSEVIGNRETNAILIDYKLYTDGEALYTGMKLAKYLRSIAPKLPIYILTNYTGTAAEHENDTWSVEEILDKRDLLNYTLNDSARTRISRFLRHLDTYADIQDNRQQRYQDLVRKTLHGQLTVDELRELTELRELRALPKLAEELEQVKALRELIEEHYILMERIESENRSRASE